MKQAEVRHNECWVYHDPKKNLFLETELGRAALNRIKKFKITNVNYNWMLMYGLDKIHKDLDVALKNKYKTKVYLGLEAFEPDQLTQCLNRNHGLNHTVKFLMPIMPPLIIKILE